MASSRFHLALQALALLTLGLALPGTPGVQPTQDIHDQAEDHAMFGTPLGHARIDDYAKATQQIYDGDVLEVLRNGELDIPLLGNVTWAVEEHDRQAHLGSYEYLLPAVRVEAGRDVAYRVSSNSSYFAGTIVVARDGNWTMWLSLEDRDSDPISGPVIELSSVEPYGWNNYTLVDHRPGRAPYEAPPANDDASRGCSSSCSYGYVDTTAINGFIGQQWGYDDIPFMALGFEPVGAGDADAQKQGELNEDYTDNHDAVTLQLYVLTEQGGGEWAHALSPAITRANEDTLAEFGLLVQYLDEPAGYNMVACYGSSAFVAMRNTWQNADSATWDALHTTAFNLNSNRFTMFLPDGNIYDNCGGSEIWGYGNGDHGNYPSGGTVDESDEPWKWNSGTLYMSWFAHRSCCPHSDNWRLSNLFSHEFMHALDGSHTTYREGGKEWYCSVRYTQYTVMYETYSGGNSGCLHPHNVVAEQSDSYFNVEAQIASEYMYPNGEGAVRTLTQNLT